MIQLGEVFPGCTLIGLSTTAQVLIPPASDLNSDINLGGWLGERKSNPGSPARYKNTVTLLLNVESASLKVSSKTFRLLPNIFP